MCTGVGVCIDMILYMLRCMVFEDLQIVWGCMGVWGIGI